METSANSLNRKKLDTIYHQESQPQVKNLKLLSGAKQILQRLMQLFVGGNDLRIWQTYDQFGNNWWHAFDPLTGRYTSVESEAEMRAWIEQRYYR